MPQMIEHIRTQILDVYLRDNVKTRLMQPDGSYIQLKPKEGETPINSQAWFLAQRL